MSTDELVSATVTIPQLSGRRHRCILNGSGISVKVAEMMPKTGTYKLELGAEALLQAYEYASPRFNSIPTATAIWNRARDAFSSKLRIKPAFQPRFRRSSRIQNRGIIINGTRGDVTIFGGVVGNLLDGKSGDDILQINASRDTKINLGESNYEDINDPINNIRQSI